MCDLEGLLRDPIFELLAGFEVLRLRTVLKGLGSRSTLRLHGRSPLVVEAADVGATIRGQLGEVRILLCGPQELDKTLVIELVVLILQQSRPLTLPLHGHLIQCSLALS